jgi:hypothetical protein
LGLDGISHEILHDSDHNITFVIYAFSTQNSLF